MRTRNERRFFTGRRILTTSHLSSPPALFRQKRVYQSAESAFCFWCGCTHRAGSCSHWSLRWSGSLLVCCGFCGAADRGSSRSSCSLATKKWQSSTPTVYKAGDSLWESRLPFRKAGTSRMCIKSFEKWLGDNMISALIKIEDDQIASSGVRSSFKWRGTRLAKIPHPVMCSLFLFQISRTNPSPNHFFASFVSVCLFF
jgi:hypothetical protein